MNIFEYHLEAIKKLIVEENKKNNLLLPGTLDGITVETPPENFNCDIS